MSQNVACAFQQPYGGTSRCKNIQSQSIQRRSQFNGLHQSSNRIPCRGAWSSTAKSGSLTLTNRSRKVTSCQPRRSPVVGSQPQLNRWHGRPQSSAKLTSGASRQKERSHLQSLTRGHSIGSSSSFFFASTSSQVLRFCQNRETGGECQSLRAARRKLKHGVRCQQDGDPWWQVLLSELGIGTRKRNASKRWGEGSDRREGRRRDLTEERPEEPRKGGSTFDELAGRARPPEPPRGGTSWRPLGGASRFQPPPDDNGYPIEGWWDTFQGERKDKDANAWGGGRTRPWWERRKKKGWGWGRLFGGTAAPDDGAPSDRPLPPRGDRRKEYQGPPEDDDPLDGEPLTPEEQALDDQLQNLVKPRRTPSDWNDWLDDSYSNKYSDYVGGAGSGWYEDESEWLKGGNPRLPPDIPERGMSRTIKEMVLRVFEPVDEVGDDLAFEERVFRFTTQETAKFLLGILVSTTVADWIVHDFVLVPFMKRYTEEVPLVAKAFDLREKQKLDIVQRLKLERQRVRFEAEIGKAPPLSEKEMREHMREEALELREEIRAENRSSFANIISDFIAGMVGLLVLVLNPKRVALMKLTGQRIFTNISDTGKAFIIILLTDIFLGYHSENGWETIVELFLDHYGLEVEQHSIYIFVSTVPVTIDAVFKLWVFRYLSKLSPSAAATFKTMNRH